MGTAITTLWLSENQYLVGVGEGNIIEDGAGCGDAMIGMDFGGLLDFDIVVPCCCTAINCCLATISLSFNWPLVRSSSRIRCCWSSAIDFDEKCN